MQWCSSDAMPYTLRRPAILTEISLSVGLESEVQLRLFRLPKPGTIATFWLLKTRNSMHSTQYLLSTLSSVPRRHWAIPARWMQESPAARRQHAPRTATRKRLRATPAIGPAKTRRVAGQQYEPRPSLGQFGAQSQQARQVLRQPPCLAMWAVAVTGRIENHRIITVAAADLTRHERHRVFGNPANRGGGQSGEFSVVPRPGHDISCRIDVRHRSPGRRCRERAAAGVSEQIEDLQRARRP